MEQATCPICVANWSTNGTTRALRESDARVERTTQTLSADSIPAKWCMREEPHVRDIAPRPGRQFRGKQLERE